MYFVVFLDSDRLWRWALHDADHRRVIGSGVGYESQEACCREAEHARGTLQDVPVLVRVPGTQSASWTTTPGLRTEGAGGFALVPRSRF